VLEANDAFLDMVGLSRADLTAGIDWTALTPPEYRQADVDGMARLRAGLPVLPLEKEYWRSDGTRVPVLIAGVLLGDEPFRWASVVFDITKRRQLERDLGAAIASERSLRGRAEGQRRLSDAVAGAANVADVTWALGRWIAEEPDVIDGKLVVGSGPGAGHWAIAADGTVTPDTSLAARASATADTAITVPLPGSSDGEVRLRFTPDVTDRASAHRAAGVIADLCGSAVERAQLRAAEHATRQRLEQIAAVTARLASAVSSADVADILVEDAVAGFGADAGLIYLLTDDGRTLALAGRRGWPEEQARRFQRVGIDDALWASLAAGIRAIMRFDNRSELAARFPALAAMQDDVGDEAWFFAPMVVASTVVGVLALSFAGEQRLSPAELQLLGTLATTASEALLRARARESAEATSVQLQRALLPASLPSHPSFEAAARYLPAAGGVHVGGDWYDVLVEDDDTLFVVGDVTGHGIDAAAVMGRTRHGLAALATTERDPGRLLTATNRFSRADGLDLFTRADGLDVMATCVVRHDRAAGTLTIATAGHPPPVLLEAGSARFLDGPVGPPLAVLATPEYPTATVPLGADPWLVLYTDGLIERRDTSLTKALERLRARTAQLAHGRDADQLTDALIASFPPSSDDDTVIVAVRFQL
jgi:PAS domain S-box-containing protein